MKSLDPLIYKIVFGLLAITSCISGITLWLGSRAEDIALEITLDSELVDMIDLDPSAPPYTLEVSGDRGHNALLIDGRSVKMISSDCGGRDCLRMPAISSSGAVIVCLPHKLVLKIIGDVVQEDDIDGLSY